MRRIHEHRGTVWLAACLVPIALGLGCSRDAAEKKEQRIDVAPTGPVQVQVVKYAGMEDALKKHKGQVVVVDFWALG